MRDSRAHRVRRNGSINLQHANRVWRRVPRQRAPIYIAAPRRVMIRHANRIVQMDSDDARRVRAQPIYVRRESQVRLHLGVSGIVPITDDAIGIPRQDFAHLRKVGDFVRRTILQTELDVARRRVRDEFVETAMQRVHVFAMLMGAFGCETRAQRFCF